jgi:hypothetical protein
LDSSDDGHPPVAIVDADILANAHRDNGIERVANALTIRGRCDGGALEDPGGYMKTETRGFIYGRIRAMQRRWMILLGIVLAAMCLTGCTRRQGMMSEILIALVALYAVLSR